MVSLVNIQEVAKVLDCSTKTVSRKVAKGLIPAVQPDGKGTHLRFDIDEVMDAVKSRSRQSTPAGTNQNTVQDNNLSGPVPKWRQTQTKLTQTKPEETK